LFHYGIAWVLITFKNTQEVRVIVRLARRYTAQKKSFRIITPYDAQRSAIEKALKTEKVHWEDKCFNVDSFQGNGRQAVSSNFC
jgi:superfamily I DNA and/or RNA helicase